MLMSKKATGRPAGILSWDIFKGRLWSINYGKVASSASFASMLQQLYERVIASFFSAEIRLKRCVVEELIRIEDLCDLVALL